MIWPLRIIGAVVFFVLLLLAQNVIRNTVDPYNQQIIILAGVNVILAVSLNLINGVTGQFSLGHAGFMGVGAYTCAAFTYYAGPRLALIDPLIFAIGLLIGALCAGIAGLLVGLPSLRLRGDYLAIVTLGFGQIVVSIIRTIKEVGDASGFTGLSRYTNVAWVFGLVVVCILSMRNLADSQLGRSMRAVRDDEIAAEAAGIDTTRVKVLAFVIFGDVGGCRGRVASALYADRLSHRFQLYQEHRNRRHGRVGRSGFDYRRGFDRSDAARSGRTLAQSRLGLWCGLGLGFIGSLVFVSALSRADTKWRRRAGLVALAVLAGRVVGRFGVDFYLWTRLAGEQCLVVALHYLRADSDRAHAVAPAGLIR